MRFSRVSRVSPRNRDLIEKEEIPSSFSANSRKECKVPSPFSANSIKECKVPSYFSATERETVKSLHLSLIIREENLALS